jgi:hypothetical protein
MKIEGMKSKFKRSNSESSTGGAVLKSIVVKWK